MHRKPDVGFDPGSPGSRPGPKAGAKPLRHPGIPMLTFNIDLDEGMWHTPGKGDVKIKGIIYPKDMISSKYPKDMISSGSLGGAAVWHLPLAQGVILETRDRIPHWASGAWSLLLPLPVSLPLSLSVTIINK